MARGANGAAPSARPCPPGRWMGPGPWRCPKGWGRGRGRAGPGAGAQPPASPAAWAAIYHGVIKIYFQRPLGNGPRKSRRQQAQADGGEGKIGAAAPDPGAAPAAARCPWEPRASLPLWASLQPVLEDHRIMTCWVTQSPPCAPDPSAPPWGCWQPRAPSPARDHAVPPPPAPSPRC